MTIKYRGYDQKNYYIATRMVVELSKMRSRKGFIIHFRYDNANSFSTFNKTYKSKLIRNIAFWWYRMII